MKPSDTDMIAVEAAVLDGQRNYTSSHSENTAHYETSYLHLHYQYVVVTTSRDCSTKEGQEFIYR